ncbi:MAG: PIN/TRAM domain-containing protein [Phycisphaeraceae bacterium]
MVLFILRGVFIVLATAVAALYLLTNQAGANVGYGVFVACILAAVGITGGLIALDAGFKQKRLSAISGIFLGLMAGLLAAYALSFVVDLFGLLTAPEVTAPQPEIALYSTQYYQLAEADQKALDAAWTAYFQEADQREAYLNLLEGVKVVIGLITCYFGISLVLQTKDDFRFIIPYVEFAKQIRGNRPIILDTSVIVDGRVLDVIETRIIQGALIVPKFVLEELQTIADSADKLRRARGRRGLDILQKLQEEQQIVDVIIDETEPEAPAVDHKLITLAQQRHARVMTNDYNLNKIATLRGVEVININDLAKSLRPVVLPGEHMQVRIVKPGENYDQGVGYLEDGTMVVVEDGREHINEQVTLVVTSTLQTSAGRMIFGRYEAEDGESGEAGATVASTAPTTPRRADDDADRSSSEPSSPDTDSPNTGPYPPPRSHRPPRGRNPRRGGR